MKGKFSVIGCQHAHIGVFIGQMLDLGHECAGIYEPANMELAANVSRQYGVPLVDQMEPLLDKDIRVVGCAAVNHEKIDVIELCEKHGLPVMIDKPAVVDRKGLNRLQAVIQRGRIQISMLLTERFRPSIHTLKEILNRGDLGEIVHIAIRKPHRLTPQKRPDWHFDKKRNGGIVQDLFVHDFDLLRWLTNREIAISTGFMGKTMLPEYPDFYDYACFQVFMDGNVTGELYADWHNPEKSWTWGDCRIFVTGTMGTAEIRLEGDPFVDREELLFKVTRDTELESVELEPLSINNTQDFLLRVDGGSSLIGHRDILAASRACVDADENADIIDRVKEGRYYV